LSPEKLSRRFESRDLIQATTVLRRVTVDLLLVPMLNPPPREPSDATVSPLSALTPE
jgi:hypothetical protein